MVITFLEIKPGSKYFCLYWSNTNKNIWEKIAKNNILFTPRNSFKLRLQFILKLVFSKLARDRAYVPKPHFRVHAFETFAPVLHLYRAQPPQCFWSFFRVFQCLDLNIFLAGKGIDHFAHFYSVCFCVNEKKTLYQLYKLIKFCYCHKILAVIQTVLAKIYFRLVCRNVFRLQGDLVDIA